MREHSHDRLPSDEEYETFKSDLIKRAKSVSRPNRKSDNLIKDLRKWKEKNPEEQRKWAVKSSENGRMKGKRKVIDAAFDMLTKPSVNRFIEVFNEEFTNNAIDIMRDFYENDKKSYMRYYVQLLQFFRPKLVAKNITNTNKNVSINIISDDEKLLDKI
jgi:hypothetical protein